MGSLFLAWHRSGAHALTTGLSGARRGGSVTLRLTAMAGGSSRTANLPFELFGPADVAAIRAGAIRRRHPAPGVGDAIPELAAHVEFQAPDLPWRYSPEGPSGAPGSRSMAPWLVLLAGAETEIVPLGRSRVRVNAAVLGLAPLHKSRQWAHVHQDDSGGMTSRILSPCTLPERSPCRAVLVPAYRVSPAGSVAPAWTGSEIGWVELPLYDTWTFTTGEGDDFPQLASKLAIATARSLGEGFGRTAIRLRERQEDADRLFAAGALMRGEDAGSEQPPQSSLGDELARWPVAEAARRWVLAPPAYDAPWRQSKDAAPGWPTELLRDPRRRAAAGLGAWCAIDQQDQLADGARQQAGALDLAAHEVRMLGMGLAASGFLFERRLPPSSDGLGRLAVLGSLLRRLPSTEGGTADRALIGRTPRLHPSLLSGALRRMIRPGTALAVGAASPPTISSLLKAANDCPERTRPTTFTELFRNVGESPDPRAVELIVTRWERDLGPFARRLVAAADELSLLARRLSARRETRPCRPVNLDKLGNAIADAVDPRRPDAPAILRVRGRYKGLGDPLPSPVFEPELDLPLATVLKKLAPYWLLPGRGLMTDHTIVALASNSRFVEAVLVGANHRALAELRWRNVRVRSGWSPLRRFWPRPNGADITPIRAWTGNLSDPSHRSIGDVSDLLVVVVRSPLLRRYPATAVYLLKPGFNVNELVTLNTEPAETDRIQPLFKGELEPDLHYIGFPITLAASPGHHLVFEEPPAGPRFRMEPPSAAHTTWESDRNNASNGAVYAKVTFHRRTVAVIKLLDQP
jgi:hypothetical protein